jgi:tRNA threonylcarbamoyladenosine biosynthesis protein TsaE
MTPSAPQLPLASEEATLALGAALAKGALPGRVLFLSGDLGAGKTTLVRGLLRALGWEGRVKSPTYALVEIYAVSRLNLYHFDFYRFKDREEWVNSGFREHFNPESLCVVEWPEKAEGLLPAPDLHLTLELSQPGRRAGFLALSEAGRAWRQSALASLLSS